MEYFYYSDNSYQNPYLLNINSENKYICNFEIQIENDKEFQVARRLIGAKVSKY